MRSKQLGRIGRRYRAGPVASDQPDPDRRRDRAAAQILKMPYRAGRWRPRYHFCASIAHRQFDMRTGRTQLKRLAAHLAAELQGSAGYGADGRVQLRQSAALHGYSAKQSGYGRHADDRLARKY